jgi:hypothetical protein
MNIFQWLRLAVVGTLVASNTVASQQRSGRREVAVHSGGFLTAPAPVQVHRMRHLSDFDWGIQPEDDYPIIAFNDATENSEAVFKYNHTGTLTADKNITVSLYEYDCVTAADAVALSQISDYSIANEISLDVDIDQETISGSNLYSSLNITTAEILFCVRLDYEYEGESLNFHETQVTISVDLSAGFNLTEILVVRTGADDAAASLSCDVEIYYCYPNGTEVLPVPSYTQGDALEVCIIPKAEDEHCCIVDITSMDIDQDQDNDGDWDAHTDPITDTITDPLSLKNCTEGDGGVCYVKTQLPSKFFSVPNPANLTLTGAAILKLCNSNADPLSGTAAPSVSPSTMAPSSVPTLGGIRALARATITATATTIDLVTFANTTTTKTIAVQQRVTTDGTTTTTTTTLTVTISEVGSDPVTNTEANTVVVESASKAFATATATANAGNVPFVATSTATSTATASATVSGTSTASAISECSPLTTATATSTSTATRTTTTATAIATASDSAPAGTLPTATGTATDNLAPGQALAEALATTTATSTATSTNTV